MILSTTAVALKSEQVLKASICQAALSILFKKN
jgi:hypothetical protein